MKILALLALLTTAFGQTGFAQTPMPTLPPTGRVPRPGGDLAYWLYGAPSPAATPIIAVNGGPGLSHLYMVQNDVWQRLSERRQVILYDQRGTGASPLTTPSAALTMDVEVADLDALREHLHLPKIDLCGDSFGGLVVIAYATAHPDRVHQLIISDGLASWKNLVHLFPQVFPDKLEANAAADNASTASPQAQAQQGLRDHFDMIFYSREKLDHYMANAKDLGYTPSTGDALGKATDDLDFSSNLPKFTFPTLVITGRYDMNVAPLTAWRIYKAIPHATFAVFEQSGHLPSYEEPDKYVQVLNDFLTH